MGSVPFDVNFRTVVQTENLPPGWNEIAISNEGTTVARVNTFPLNPGETLSISGNLGEMFMGIFTITFEGVGTNLVRTIEKRYNVGGC